VTAVLNLGTRSPSGFEVPPESVRTLLVGSRCPVCGRVQLRGRQTVCSARCRRIRTRQRDKERRQARNREIRELLLIAQKTIEAALTKLEDEQR
jgi:predicted nucleic acid-binding Zn ribbon protein